MQKDFETAFKELSKLIETMEKGGLSLNDSLRQFERGVSLIRDCQKLLKNAEQKIEFYRKNKGNTEKFNPPAESDQG